MMSEDFRIDEEATEISPFDQALAERTHADHSMNRNKWSLRHWVHSTVQVDSSVREDGVSEGCPSHAVPLIPRPREPSKSNSKSSNIRKVWVAMPWAPFSLKRKQCVTSTEASPANQDSPSAEYNLSGRHSVNGDLEFTGLLVEQEEHLAWDPLQRPVSSQEGNTNEEANSFPNEMISVEFHEHEIQQENAGWIPLSPTAMEEWVAPLRQRPSKISCVCSAVTLLGVAALLYLLVTLCSGDKDSEDDDWHHHVEENSPFPHFGFLFPH